MRLHHDQPLRVEATPTAASTVDVGGGDSGARSLSQRVVLECTPSERTDRGWGRARSRSGLKWWEQLACTVVRAGPVPRHVAFIMDGNRRFARERGWLVETGHRHGYQKLEEALRWCCELGVHGVTVYAFSIENFKRSAEEVQALMEMTAEKLRAMSDEQSIVQRNGVRVLVVGDLTRVSDSLRSEMRRVMRMTQGNSRHTLTVCFSYTARHEIAAAVRRLGTACDSGRLEPSDIHAELLERSLLTASPAAVPVDLIVRTSGEQRLSDFLLWQSATCAVAFTRVLWPELSLARFLSVLLRFQRTQPYMRGLRPGSGPRGGGSGCGAGCGESCGGGSDPHAAQPAPHHAQPTSHADVSAEAERDAVAAATRARSASRPSSSEGCDCGSTSAASISSPHTPLACAASAALPVLALVAACSAIVVAASRVAGRSPPAAAAAAACAAAVGWVAAAMLLPTGGDAAPVGGRSHRALKATEPAAGDGSRLAGSGGGGPAMGSLEPSGRRVREYLAELNVDRRL